MKKKILSLYLPWLFWMGIIFYLSSIPEVRISQEDLWDLILRKLAHMLVFGILFLLSWRISTQQKIAKPYLWAFIWAVVYALSDEFHQSFIPTRVASSLDVIIDCGGVLMAGLILYLVPSLRILLSRR